jgi:predicted nicotinamide N-methyase
VGRTLLHQIEEPLPRDDDLDKLRARLAWHLRGRTRLTEATVEAGGCVYRVTHPAAADALIDEDDFARDERLPYWAELWPSAVALARCISGESLAGRRVIELGCGIGLPAVVALAGGAEVTATDHYEAALDFVRYNARANLGAREPEVRLLDWHTYEAGGLGLFDLVLAADVLYEARNVQSLAALIPALLAPGGELLLADPRRKDTPYFLEEMIERGFRSSTEEHVALSGGREVVVLVHRLRRDQNFGQSGSRGRQ